MSSYYAHSCRIPGCVEPALWVEDPEGERYVVLGEKYRTLKGEEKVSVRRIGKTSRLHESGLCRFHLQRLEEELGLETPPGRDGEPPPKKIWEVEGATIKDPTRSFAMPFSRYKKGVLP